MNGPEHEPAHVCPGCGNEIDPETCWCGEGDHGYGDGGPFIPMGCECHRRRPRGARRPGQGGGVTKQGERAVPSFRRS